MKILLVLSAAIEAATGLALLLSPSLPVAMLLIGILPQTLMLVCLEAIRFSQ